MSPVALGGGTSGADPGAFTALHRKLMYCCKNASYPGNTGDVLFDTMSHHPFETTVLPSAPPWWASVMERVMLQIPGSCRQERKKFVIQTISCSERCANHLHQFNWNKPNSGTILAEHQGWHENHLFAAARQNLPDPNHAVGAAGRQVAPVAAEGQRPYHPLVPLQLLQ